MRSSATRRPAVEALPAPLIEGVHGGRSPGVVTAGTWFGYRVFDLSAGADVTEEALFPELDILQRRFSKGFALRLSGNFATIYHVQMWERALEQFPALHLFGFTVTIESNRPADMALIDLVLRAWRRFHVRFASPSIISNGVK